MTGPRPKLRPPQLDCAGIGSADSAPMDSGKQDRGEGR